MSKLRERVGDIDCKAEMGTLLPDESHTQLSDALGDALDLLDEMAKFIQGVGPGLPQHMAKRGQDLLAKYEGKS